MIIEGDDVQKKVREAFGLDDNVKVPINPNFLFCFEKSLYRSEQNGAKNFVFG